MLAPILKFLSCPQSVNNSKPLLKVQNCRPLLQSEAVSQASKFKFLTCPQPIINLQAFLKNTLLSCDHYSYLPRELSGSTFCCPDRQLISRFTSGRGGRVSEKAVTLSFGKIVHFAQQILIVETTTHAHMHAEHNDTIKTSNTVL